MKFMPRHRGHIAVKNDTIHEWACLSVTEKNDHATYFPNAPRIVKMGEIWGRNQNDKKLKIWIFLHKIICCGCVFESPHRGDSNTHPKHMILWRTYDN